MKLEDLVEQPRHQQRVIEGHVSVPHNITELDYSGAIVKGNFDCRLTEITSLEGSPKHVEGDFLCNNNKIKSLKGAPEYVGGNFNCTNTFMTSLHNVHKIVKHIGGLFYLSNTIKSRVMGVMMIKGLPMIQFFTGNLKQHIVDAIINKHLKGDRDIHECQEELLEAGLSEYAKL